MVNSRAHKTYFFKQTKKKRVLCSLWKVKRNRKSLDELMSQEKNVFDELLARNNPVV